MNPERYVTLIRWRQLSPEQQEREYLAVVHLNTELGKVAAKLEQDLGSLKVRVQLCLDAHEKQLQSDKPERFLDKLRGLWGKRL